MRISPGDPPSYYRVAKRGASRVMATRGDVIGLIFSYGCLTAPKRGRGKGSILYLAMPPLGGLEMGDFFWAEVYLVIWRVTGYQSVVG
jgi:hypothetical protein